MDRITAAEVRMLRILSKIMSKEQLLKLVEERGAEWRRVLNINININITK